ncbi:helix-turn-helix protein [compost metagenome]
MPVKNKLKEIRMKEYMITQTDFCDMLELKSSNYSKLESNKQQCSIETMFKIAKKLNRKVDDIWFLE